MTSAGAELDPWLESLDETTVVLTPNRRLSRFIQQHYAQFQRRRGRQAWPTLPCYSLSGWLQSLWVQLQQSAIEGTDQVLLSAVQENILWEQIIRQHSAGHELLNPRQTAGVAMDAWHKLLQWQLTPELLNSRQADKLLYQRWLTTYRDFCRERRLTDSSQILGLLRQAITAQQLPLPGAIALYGFDTITPLQRSLLDCYTEQGVRVYPVNVTTQSRVRRIALDDEEAEITTAARWAAGLLVQQGAVDASLRIGIVVPQLTVLRAKVERLFNNVFEPQHLLISNPRHVPVFNVSVAQPLSQTPLVQAALQGLQLNRAELEMERVSQILLSPWLGRIDELPCRALLDADLRATALMLRPGRLRTAAGAQVSRCPDMFRRLQAFHHLERTARGRNRWPSEWATVFAGQLAALGWPGERSLDPMEHQQLQHWQEVLDSLAGLDPISGQCEVTVALAQLAQLAWQYPFHARTGESPVQILGLLEAAGMLFDHLWIMQMDNLSWPLPPDPNPLIPIRQQVELRMPGAAVEGELQFARTMTQRLAGAAGQVLFSHSRFRDDVALRPSPLIEEYAAVTVEQLPLIAAVDYYQELQQTAAMVNEIDRQGPALTGPAAVRGGTQILKDQAACPFRAYARHRLRARALEQAQPGISPMEHGKLLHRALEILWRRLGNQQALLRLSAAALNAMITAAITESFFLITADRKPGKRLQDLESQRLQALIQSWLELEKQRQPFTVAINESERDLALAGLPLHVRYDRVDELADGGLFVIDYKTGQPDIADWIGTRPEEPQVPIYCIANEQRIIGAAFGVLNVREIAFKGIGTNAAIAPGIVIPEAADYPDLPGNWRDLMRYWRGVLEALARDFMAGAAAVEPKSVTTSCRYCDLPALCRIGEHDDTDQHAENADGD